MPGFSKKPGQPPAFDSKGFVTRLREITAKVGLGPFPVFADEGLPKLHRWIMSTGEYDGADAGGLRDVLNANALGLDAVKDDLDAHKKTDNERHTALALRVTALEGQGTSVPFPGSG